MLGSAPPTQQPLPVDGASAGQGKEGQERSSGLREAPSVWHLPRPNEARLSCRLTLRICCVSGPTLSRLINTDSE